VRSGRLRGQRYPVWTSLLVGIVASGLASSPARSETGWSVRSFDVAIAVHPDAALDVTETIDADFDVPKHGIYREIPIRYAVGLHQYALRFHLLGVDDGDGRAYGTEVTYEENRIRIRIGDPGRTITGPARIPIRYRVERAIIWERNRAWAEAAPDQDRAVLRWVATGTEWGVPIRRATVTVHLPRDLGDSQVDYDAWTGAYGARNKDFTKRRVDARTIAFETGTLRPGESITIDVTMLADAVARAAWTRELAWWLVDNFAYGLFPVTLAACLASWFFWGRDLPGRGAIVVGYEPPEGLGPAEVGTLIDERVDLRDISAVIIDLAVRGYLKIEEVRSNSSERSGRDYRFTRLKGPDDLKPFEKQLYSQIFDGEESVLMSDLETKFYPVIGRVKNDLYRGLSKQGYFDGKPDTVRTTFLVLGLIAVAAALGLAAVVQTWVAGRLFVFPIAVAGVLSAAAVAITSRVMPRKTRKGRVAWEQIAGLEEYIRRAEVDDITAQDRRGIFERLLPYAIIFGLSSRWAKAFADLYTQPPDWYQPVDPTGYTTALLMRDLDRSVSTMNTTFPSMPRSTGTSSAWPTGQGYSWSSGGFGGGGSSGGGFGGGGGGSW
jgi:uncharacterized membrane protein YgcG